jgi:hypothetical protein
MSSFFRALRRLQIVLRRLAHTKTRLVQKGSIVHTWDMFTLFKKILRESVLSY